MQTNPTYLRDRGYTNGHLDIPPDQYTKVLETYTEVEYIDEQLAELQAALQTVRGRIGRWVSLLDEQYDSLIRYRQQQALHQQQAVELNRQIQHQAKEWTYWHERIIAQRNEADMHTPHYSGWQMGIFALIALVMLCAEWAAFYQVLDQAFGVNGREGYLIATGIVMMSFLAKLAFDRLIEQHYRKSDRSRIKNDIHHRFLFGVVLLVMASALAWGDVRYTFLSEYMMSDGEMAFENIAKVMSTWGAFGVLWLLPVLLLIASAVFSGLFFVSVEEIRKQKLHQEQAREATQKAAELDTQRLELHQKLIAEEDAAYRAALEIEQHAARCQYAAEALKEDRKTEADLTIQLAELSSRRNAQTRQRRIADYLDAYARGQVNRQDRTGRMHGGQQHYTPFVLMPPQDEAAKGRIHAFLRQLVAGRITALAG